MRTRIDDGSRSVLVSPLLGTIGAFGARVLCAGVDRAGFAPAGFDPGGAGGRSPSPARVRAGRALFGAAGSTGFGAGAVGWGRARFLASRKTTLCSSAGSEPWVSATGQFPRAHLGKMGLRNV